VAPATVGVLKVNVVPSHIGPLLDAVGVAGAPGAVKDIVVGHVVTQPAALRTFIV